MSLKTEGTRLFVAISSRAPFNDAFAKLRLQVKCPGTGSVIKTLTILPDLAASVPQAQITSPSSPAEAESTSVPPQSEAHDIAPAANLSYILAQPDIKNKLADNAARPVHKQRLSASRTSRKKQGHLETTKLILSSDFIDESRFGKVDTEKRALLLAQQKQLDDDDQLVKLIAMQNQLKQMQDELGVLKLKLAQSEGITDPAASSVPAPSAKPLATAGTRESLPQLEAANIAAQTSSLANTTQPASAVRSVKATASKVVVPPPSMLDEILGEPLYLACGAAALLGLGGFGFMLARRSSKVGKVDSTSTRIAAPIAPSPDTGDFTRIANASPISLAESGDIDPISEADLFLNFGRVAQAEEILKDGLKKNPGNQQIRLKLLSIYAKRKDTRAFSDIARQVKDSGDAEAWAQAAEMGCDLEPGNPMYGGDDSSVTAAETGRALLDEAKTEQSAASLDFDLDFGAAEAGPAVLDVPLDVTTSAPSALDFDLSLGAPAKIAPAVVEHESPVVPSSTQGEKAAPIAAKAGTIDLIEINLNLDAPT